MFSPPLVTWQTWALLAALSCLLLIYGYAPYGFFQKLGIPGPKPLPFIGTFLEYGKGFHNFDMECFQKYGRMWGFYDGRQPVLSVMDPIIIKTFLIKECYTVFTNRRSLGLRGPLYDSVNNAEDEVWRRIRSILSPNFTSGRLKEMFPIMQRHSNNLVKSLMKVVGSGKPVEIKEYFGAYSMDTVTSTSFSVEIDSLNNPNDPFVTNIKKLINFNFMSPLVLLIMFFPFLIPLFEKVDISFFPKPVMEFFYGSLRKIKADRKKNVHDNRVDFLQLMVDSQTDESAAAEQSFNGLTDHEILSQSMIFIFAGYETSSGSLSFTAYNLATNPDTMRKLQEEIDAVFPHEAPVTYEGLQQMEYLDMVISESLRLYPPAARVERMCKKTVEINGVTIPKGTSVMVPTWVLHRDPELWTDPELFKPERFSKDNRETMDPYSYLPFGAGPRNCIGMRFALILMKLALVQVLQNFSFVTCEETEIPLQLGNSGILCAKNPVKLKVVPRSPAATEE